MIDDEYVYDYGYHDHVHNGDSAIDFCFISVSSVLATLPPTTTTDGLVHATYGIFWNASPLQVSNTATI